MLCVCLFTYQHFPSLIISSSVSNANLFIKILYIVKSRMSSPLWFVHVVNMIVEMFMVMRVAMIMFYGGVMFMNVVMSVSVLVLVNMKVAVSVGVVAGLLALVAVLIVIPVVVLVVVVMVFTDGRVVGMVVVGEWSHSSA